MDLNSKKSGFRFSNPELVHLEYETNQSFCEESEIQLRINLSTDVKPYEGKSKAEVILTITLGGKTEKDPFYLEAWNKQRLIGPEVNSVMKRLKVF